MGSKSLYMTEELRSNSKQKKAPPNIRECCLTCKHAPVIMDHIKKFLDPKITECKLTGERQVANRTVCKQYSYDANYENKEKIYPFEK